MCRKMVFTSTAAELAVRVVTFVNELRKTVQIAVPFKICLEAKGSTTNSTFVAFIMGFAMLAANKISISNNDGTATLT